MTKEEFIKQYTDRSDISDYKTCYGYNIDGVKAYAVPCDCGEEGCEGWAMAPLDPNAVSPFERIRDVLEFFSKQENYKKESNHDPVSGITLDIAPLPAPIFISGRRKAKEAMDALDQIESMPQTFPLVQLKSLTLGSDLEGKITEKQAVDLVNTVLASLHEVGKPGEHVVELPTHAAKPVDDGAGGVDARTALDALNKMADIARTGDNGEDHDLSEHHKRWKAIHAILIRAATLSKSCAVVEVTVDELTEALFFNGAESAVENILRAFPSRHIRIVADKTSVIVRDPTPEEIAEIAAAEYPPGFEHLNAELEGDNDDRK